MTADLFTDEVLPLFEEHRADWLERARAAGQRICIERGEVTIDDVRRECPPPADIDPRVMGAVLRRPIFEVVGYRKSWRTACHNRPVAVHRFAAPRKADGVSDMNEVLAELEAIRTELAPKPYEFILDPVEGLDRAEQRVRLTTRLLPPGDDDGGD